jgi:beta-glucosidase
MSVIVVVLLAAAVALGIASRRLPRRVPYGPVDDGEGPFLFPAGFLWGAASADQQIEHQQPSDWTEFERRARALGNQSVLDNGAPVPGHIKKILEVKPEILLMKADFDRKHADDLRAAALMGHNAHRFSISWARMFPREDMHDPDPAAVAFYDRVFVELKKNGLVPFVTLFHFASPAWLWNEVGGKRGVERSDAVEHFKRFVEAVVERWGDQVHFWCTINEPMVYAYQGYLDGTFPPNERRGGPRDVVPVVKALLEMHTAAYYAIHDDADRRKSEASVGIAHHVRAFMPWRDGNLLDRVTASFIEKAFVDDFLDAMHTGELRMSQTGVVESIPGLRGTFDYVGVNHYGRFYVKTKVSAPGKFEIINHDDGEPLEDKSELGWAIDEASLTSCLARFHEKYGEPLYVLENGCAEASLDDARRQKLLVRTTQALWRAIHHHGADVRGYFHWSLTDNFEWAEGFDPRFGLLAVDYEHDFARTPRKSAEVYREIASSNSIPGDLWRRFRR